MHKHDQKITAYKNGHQIMVVVTEQRTEDEMSGEGMWSLKIDHAHCF